MTLKKNDAAVASAQGTEVCAAFGPGLPRLTRLDSRTKRLLSARDLATGQLFAQSFAPGRPKAAKSITWIHCRVRKNIPKLSVGLILLALSACNSGSVNDTRAPANTKATHDRRSRFEMAPIAEARTVGNLPLPVGYYAVNSECGPALRDRDLGIVITATRWQEIHRDYDILPVRQIGRGKYALGNAVQSLRQASPRRYFVDEGLPTERQIAWCAPTAPGKQQAERLSAAR